MITKKSFLRLKILTLSFVPFLGLVSCSFSTSDIGLVTDAGSIFDRSFNQLSWEGILKLKPNASESLDAIQPISHSPSNLINAYSVHVAAGKKYIVAPGFYHHAGISVWNQEQYDKYMNFILLDANLEATNVASATYETAAAGFLAGYLTSDYLNAKRLENLPEYQIPKIGMWGGGDFPGVTDFMVGMVYGVDYYNSRPGSNQVKFAKFKTPGAYTDSGFESGGGSSKAQFLLGEGAQVLFPVSGPQVADAITEIEKTPKKFQKIIGVDSDATLKFPTQKAFFITSILKDLSKTVEYIYRKIKLDPTVPDFVKPIGGQTVGTIANGLTNVVNNLKDGAWDGIANSEELYEKATKSDMIQIATSTVNQKTWNDALKLLERL